MIRNSIAAFSACLLFPLAGIASGATVMPSHHYDHIAAKLIMDGYTSIRVVDAAIGRMAAYDLDGSEVIIHVDERSRTVLSTTYVRGADQ